MEKGIKLPEINIVQEKPAIIFSKAWPEVILTNNRKKTNPVWTSYDKTADSSTYARAVKQKRTKVYWKQQELTRNHFANPGERLSRKVNYEQPDLRIIIWLWPQNRHNWKQFSFSTFTVDLGNQDCGITGGKAIC